MRKAARFGVVLGDSAPQACRSAIQASMQNLNVLIDGACAKTTFSELLDYLHQDKIWVYTPQGHLHELPQGATVVDFAYSASLFLGNHAVGAKINGETKPLSTPLHSGQVIEIITDVLATPNPDWLSFVNTQKARRALQNILREQDIEEQRLVGQQALNRALKLFNVSIKDLTESDWLELFNGDILKVKTNSLNKLPWAIYCRNWLRIICLRMTKVHRNLTDSFKVLRVSMLNTHIAVTLCWVTQFKDIYHAAVLLCIVHVVITSYMNNICTLKISCRCSGLTRMKKKLVLLHIY